MTLPKSPSPPVLPSKNVVKRVQNTSPAKVETSHSSDKIDKPKSKSKDPKKELSNVSPKKDILPVTKLKKENNDTQVCYSFFILYHLSPLDYIIFRIDIKIKLNKYDSS